MAQASTQSGPRDRIFQIDHVAANTELRLTLIAAGEATVTYGSLTKTSTNGTPATGAEEVGGPGNHVIEVASNGGHVQLTVEDAGEKVVDFQADDEGPTTYRWTFAANPNWSGGHINEEASEIARVVEAGGEPPSRPPSGEIPEKAAPALGSEFTRPWAPDKESPPYAPRKARRPVDDDLSDEGREAPAAHREYNQSKPGGGDPAGV